LVFMTPPKMIVWKHEKTRVFSWLMTISIALNYLKQ
jgi:hypothetical protein